MKFNHITELLQSDSLRTSGQQDNCRNLWPDQGGKIFADEVLGDHQQALGKLGEQTGEAVAQQEKNERFRAGTAQYISEAQSRDAVLTAELDRIEAAGNALNNKNAALRDAMAELAGQEPQLSIKMNEVINRCRSIEA